MYHDNTMFFLDTLLNTLHKQYDCDYIDQLNNYWTPIILVITALTLAARQYVGEPIQCWIPGNFPSSWEQYIESLCYTQNTYYVDLKQTEIDLKASRALYEVAYYQWVPTVLGLQAMMFCIPSLIWKFANFQLGDTTQLFNALPNVDTIDMKICSANAKKFATHIFKAFASRSKFQKHSVTSYFIYNGSYLTSLYLFCKILYLLQILLQFYFLNHFLSTKDMFWGIGILNDILNGKEWEHSGHFPRVTMCDFEIVQIKNTASYTVQCAIMINMLNEKIYIILWFWLVILGMITTMNFLCWCDTLLCCDSGKFFILNQLQYNNSIENISDLIANGTIAKFTNDLLKTDGIFILNLVQINNGTMFCYEVIEQLLREFLENEDNETKKKQPSELVKSA